MSTLQWYVLGGIVALVAVAAIVSQRVFRHARHSPVGHLVVRVRPRPRVDVRDLAAGLYGDLVQQGTIADKEDALPREDFEMLVSIVASILVQDDRPLAGLTLDSDFVADHGFDSLEIVEAAYAVEDDLDVKITDDDLLRMHCLRDVVALILMRRGRVETAQ